MCKCCPLLKYPESWFESCVVSWFLSNSLIPSRALALWFLSVLSLSCIWVPACCRFGSSLCWAESTELLAVARETQQPTEQTYCSRAQDLVSLHPIPWCCIKTPQSLCFVQNWDFYFWVDASKEHQQGTFCMAAAEEGWAVGNADSCSSGCHSVSYSWGKWPGIPCRIWSTGVCTVVAQAWEYWTDWNKKDINIHAQRLRTVLSLLVKSLFFNCIWNSFWTKRVQGKKLIAKIKVQSDKVGYSICVLWHILHLYSKSQGNSTQPL